MCFKRMVLSPVSLPLPFFWRQGGRRKMKDGRGKSEGTRKKKKRGLHLKFERKERKKRTVLRSEF